MLINFFKKRLFSDFRISSLSVLHWQVFISPLDHVSTVGWLPLCSIIVHLGLKLRSSAYLQLSWKDHITFTYTGQASLNGAESARGGGKCFWIIMQSITILFKKKKEEEDTYSSISCLILVSLWLVVIYLCFPAFFNRIHYEYFLMLIKCLMHSNY